MNRKTFLHYWDNVWQFLDDVIGAIALFALLYIGLWAAYIFG